MLHTLFHPKSMCAHYYLHCSRAACATVRHMGNTGAMHVRIATGYVIITINYLVSPVAHMTSTVLQEHITSVTYLVLIWFRFCSQTDCLLTRFWNGAGIPRQSRHDSTCETIKQYKLCLTYGKYMSMLMKPNNIHILIIAFH